MQDPAAAATVPFITPYGELSILTGQSYDFVDPVTAQLLEPDQPRYNQLCIKDSLIVDGDDYRLKAARLCPRTREEKNRQRNYFDLCTAIHETESPRVQRPLDPEAKGSIEPEHRFEVNLEPDYFTEEKYALFHNYQYHVHKEGPDEVSRDGFKRFLCSGMGQTQRTNNDRSQKLGSYHQCYRLDGRLVAIGVLDLLPDCVSSVYLVYHQDVQEWSFGKLSALREISLAIEGNHQYYYMGYYIHSCGKMRYKNQYKPTFLLDLETYSWNLLDADHLARLSARKYVSMSLERQLRLPPRISSTSDDLGLDSAGLTKLQHYLRPGETSDAFGSFMPGIMTLDEVQNEIDLDGWRVKLSDFIIVRLDALRNWSTWDFKDPSSPKGVVAELAAALGPALVNQFILDFTR
ncbi:MAG: hypothetical protein Q9218_000338 [Villophora microphyllina]